MSILQWEALSEAERIAIRQPCEESFEFFTRVFFQLLEGQRFKKNWHHSFFFQLLEEVYDGKHERLIINCPPGATKTEILSIHWIAWCVMQCVVDGRSSRWLPISYSADLVDENSLRVKEILMSEEFNYFWPLEISKDTKGKSNWKFTDQNGNVHRLYGTSLMGQVTGRRAGFMTEAKKGEPTPFTGALILDDPLPPKEESHGRSIEKYNKALNRIVRSRLAQDNVPIIMIQQRIAKNDSTAFMMSDKAPDNYSLYSVKGVIDGEYIKALPKNVQQECIDSTGFTGEKVSYWQDKEPLKSLQAIEKADPYLFYSQYQQEPSDAFLEGVIYKRECEMLVAEGRLRNIPVEPRLPVYTYWDIGMGDATVIWLMQPFRSELRLIACHGSPNKGFEYFANWLDDFKQDYQIRYQAHYGPHDIQNREWFSGDQTRKQLAKQRGFTFKKVNRPKVKKDSIDALRTLFPRLYIDENRCAKGWEALKKYRREWDADNEVFSRLPVHDWTSDYCFPGDALIETDRGSVEIQDVRSGDRVVLGGIYADVADSQQTGIKETVVVEFDDGSQLECTGNHKIFTTRGLLAADTLRYNDSVLTGESDVSCWLQSAKGLRAAFIESFRESDTGTGKREICTPHRLGASSGFCIVTCGSFVGERSPRAMQLFLSMMTGMTLISTTGSVAPEGRTASRLSRSMIWSNSMGQGITKTPERGITTSRVMGSAGACTEIFTSSLMARFLKGIQFITRITTRPTTRLKTLRSCLKGSISHITAKPGLGLVAKRIYSILPRSEVRPLNGTSLKRVGSGIKRTASELGKAESRSHRSALCVSQNSRPISREQSSAPESVKHVISVRRGSRKPVYNITVDHHHAYVAGGVLVSNCDSLQQMGLSWKDPDPRGGRQEVTEFNPIDPTMGY